jgi:hypothetical protein
MARVWRNPRVLLGVAVVAALVAVAVWPRAVAVETAPVGPAHPQNRTVEVDVFPAC